MIWLQDDINENKDEKNNKDNKEIVIEKIWKKIIKFKID